ncbi:MAG: hypothetical protein IJ639_12325, partial [Ruminococcus sp.]|nr:hypothetical protein [Ruminococcus sp.]
AHAPPRSPFRPASRRFPPLPYAAPRGQPAISSTSIFIVPPSFEELQARLEGRGTETPEVIAARLKTAREELEHHHLFDYVVVNDDVDRAVKEVLSIISDRKNKLDIKE